MWAGHLPTAVVTVVLLDRVGLRDATLTLEITAMTDDKIALGEPLEKGSDATLLREMIDFAARRLMQLETDALCGAEHGERSENRLSGWPGMTSGRCHQRAQQQSDRIDEDMALLALDQLVASNPCRSM